MVDLNETEIGASIKISSIKLPENVIPTIQGRDFVVATVASPSIVIEPEKPTEESAAEKEIVTGEEIPSDSVEKTAEDIKDQDTKTKDQGAKPTVDKKEKKTKK